MERDLDNGFVLNQKQALEYLKECAVGWFESGTEDGESITAQIDDLVGMANKIYAHNWEWVLFERFDMSASGIVIKQMTAGELN